MGHFPQRRQCITASLPFTQEDIVTLYVLGDVVDQGRNVVICGLPDAAISWQQLQYRWPNKPSPGELEKHMRGTLGEIGLYRPSCLFWYKAECTPSRKMYVRSVGGLTGLVAARNGGPEKFDDMQDLAAAANHVVFTRLNVINQLPFNVLTMDFVSDKVSLVYIGVMYAGDRLPHFLN